MCIRKESWFYRNKFGLNYHSYSNLLIYPFGYEYENNAPQEDVDIMVEYGEDYTDAATVMEGMQTAYQVGKGYEKKVKEIAEVADNEIADSEATDSDVADNKIADSENPDAEAADSENPDTEAAENKIAETETLDSEVEAEQLDEKTIGEYDDGAVFKDNAIGIGGVGAPEDILPVNDISVPYVS